MTGIVFDPYVATGSFGEINGVIAPVSGFLADAADNVLIAQLQPMVAQHNSDVLAEIRNTFDPVRALLTTFADGVVVGALPATRAYLDDFPLAPSVNLLLGGSPPIAAAIQTTVTVFGTIEAYTNPIRSLISPIAPAMVVADTAQILANLWQAPDYVGGLGVFQSPGFLSIDGGDYQTGVANGLADAILLLDSMRTVHAFGMSDSVAIGSAITTRADFDMALADTLNLGDRLGVGFIQALTDTLALTDSVALTLELAALVDSLVLTAACTTTMEAHELIADALVMTDVAFGALILDMADGLILTDAVAPHWDAKLAMIDGLAFNDSLAQTMTLMAVMEDTVEFGDSIATRMDAIFSMRDDISLSVRLRVDDGVYVAYAFNTASRGASRYLNYPFNSFCELNGRLLGATSGGLFAIEGADDDGEPIDARIRTGLDNFGTTQLKRMTQAYLGYRTNGDVLLKVITTSAQGVKADYTYKVVAVNNGDVRNSTVKIGKGLKSVYWAVEVMNVDGSEFLLDTLSIVPLISPRRVNG